MPSNNSFESLPVELIADILSELDLTSLVTVSYLSHRLRAVASEPSLNPWRPPILRTLLSQEGNYDPCLKHLSVRSIVPRQNFVGVLSLARAHYLLFEASLPNLSEREWEECFRRRFLPGWTKVRKDSSWRTAFLKCVLFLISSYLCLPYFHPESCTVFGIALTLPAPRMKLGQSITASFIFVNVSLLIKILGTSFLIVMELPICWKASHEVIIHLRFSSR